MGRSKLWQLPVAGRLGVQHGLLVGWFLLVGVLAVLLLPGPAGSATAPGSLVEAQTVDFGGQSHCGVVVGIGASGGGSGSGDVRCASVEAGGNAQVESGGFGDIGMQFQDSPVGAAISNVHISNEGDNNSNNSIIGNSDLIINGNTGASANALPAGRGCRGDSPIGGRRSARRRPSGCGARTRGVGGGPRRSIALRRGGRSRRQRRWVRER